MWDVMHAKDALYAKEDFTEEDGIKAGELEAEFGEMGGYEAESNAASFLSDLGVKEDMHGMLMKDIPSNLKVRVLLATNLDNLSIFSFNTGSAKEPKSLAVKSSRAIMATTA